ncbi:MAG TPA: TolC family protein [Bacteroidota bacterium]|nr:TolC family protein [Bacteroidota bacterium]
MNKKTVLAGWCLFFLCPFVRAQSQQHASTPLTIEQAVRLALQNNPELRTSKLEMDKSNKRVMEAWGTTLPAVDLSGTYVHLIDKPVSYFPDYLIYPLYKIMDSTARFPKATGQLILLPGSMSPGFTAGASLNVRQILFNGAVFIGIGAASIYSHLATDLYTAKRVETVTRVRKVYYGALLAREAADLMKSSLKNAEDNLKNVQLLEKQGIISEYDELRATVGVENLRPMVIQSENNFELALDGLRNTVGLPDKEDISLTDSLTFQPVDDGVLGQAENLTLEANPGLSAVRRQIELNGAVVNAERSNYLPTIAAFGSYQYSGIKNEFNFSTNDFYKSSQIGLTLSLNLFQGLQTYSRVEQAQMEERKSEEQLSALERNLRTGVHSTRNNLEQSMKRLEAQQKTIEMAEQGYKIVTTRFLNSSATQLEVNDAQLALTQAKVNRVQALYDYLVASADLDQLMGRLPAYASGIED